MNDLPEDLARPRHQNRSDVASLVTGILLLSLLAGLVAFYFTVTPQ